jgi:hypothetical protein
MRQATDVAGVCKEIVLRTAMEIQGRKFVKVEGWQSIATAHGCVASIREVRQTEDGTAAVAELKRISDGAVLASAEGYVGADEPTWYGGDAEVWDKELRRKVMKTLPKRPDYAIRAMAQTRAISRVCRSAFAHVVVMMDAGLQTTPAEEMAGIEVTAEPVHEPKRAESVRQAPARATENTGTDDPDWRMFPVPKFVKKYHGGVLGDMAKKDLAWWATHYEPKPCNGSIQQKDLDFQDALKRGAATLQEEDESGASNPDLEEADAR